MAADQPPYCYYAAHNHTRGYAHYRRHEHISELRRLTFALAQLDANPNTVRRVAECCTNARVWQHPTFGHRLVTNACKHRLCPICAASAARKAAAQLHLRLQQARSHLLAFITLTRKQAPREPFTYALATIQRAWRLLTRMPQWTTNVAASWRVIEVKPSATYPGQWHVHIHALIDAKYFPQEHLRHLWQHALEHAHDRPNSKAHPYRPPADFTPDAGAHIQRVGPTERTVDYIVKYVKKPLPTALADNLPAYLDCVRHLHHARLHAFAGNWTAKAIASSNAIRDQLPLPTHPYRDRTWVCLGDLDFIVHAAAQPRHPDSDPCWTILQALGWTQRPLTPAPVQPAPVRSRDPPQPKEHQPCLSA